MIIYKERGESDKFIQLNLEF